MANDFEFDALDHARNYRKAVLNLFAPCLKGVVAEIGSGVGHFTKLLLEVREIEHLVCVEPNPDYSRHLRSQLQSCRVVEGDFNENLIPEGFDAIISTNVLEHIEKDEEELARYRSALAQKKGRLCLFVPARQELYSAIDKDFGHYRRYNRKSLHVLLGKSGFEVVEMKHFNFIGYFIWLANFRLMGARRFNPNMVRLFDRRIFPISHSIENKMSLSFVGQSLYAIATPVI